MTNSLICLEWPQVLAQETLVQALAPFRETDTPLLLLVPPGGARTLAACLGEDLGVLAGVEPCFRPVPPPPAANLGYRAWWEQAATAWRHDCELAGHECAQAFSRRPVAQWLEPGEFLPQAAHAGSLEGLPLMLGAPFEDSRPGLPLAYAGALLLRGHLEVRWEQESGGLAGALAALGSFAAPGACTCVRLHVPEGPEPRAAALAELRRALPEWRRQAPPIFGQELAARACQPAPLPPAEVLALAGRIEPCLRPLAVGGQWLSLAQQLFVLSEAATQWRAGAGPGFPIFPRELLGPLGPEESFGEILVDRTGLLQAAATLRQELAQTGRVPPCLRLGDFQASPSAFLVALAQCLAGDLARVKIGERPLPNYYATQKDVRRAAGEAATVGPGRHRQAVILSQCWTARPALGAAP